MSTIEDLEEKEGRLDNQLQRVRASLANARIDAHPNKVGDAITDRRGVECMVEAVRVSQWGSVRLSVVYRKKNGEWGKAVKTFYQ